MHQGKVRRKVFGYRHQRSLRFKSIDALLPSLRNAKTNKHNSFSQDAYDRELRYKTDLSDQKNSDFEMDLIY